ncbi:hypothetical protein P153DRAFT_296388 [Dothidotthia symphoricarpi CBS 119687]|uniref:DUF4604 domain-containing protein n=1 Tax=Dothidotthia symphoricarpi CBS 119687 TaxID=1392245 RepID=A0A6A6A7P3_9PLEO|nr:uncharacterized protein P153DRAFT_296388 [Dothidotthia symphoricarpi CBS 119687]KAF2126837.1 hypothetical protein P153DRAFT_296388 [Dothidotthia symphoricarpi CBS 119687]
MSFKAKDLQFDNSQPAFLQRLRGQMAGDDSARHERPVPRNKRMKQDDEDDAPTYVLEDTNQSLSKEEYEAFVTGKDGDEDQELAKEGSNEQQAKEDGLKSKDNIAELGAASRKRKAAKVISDELDESKTEEKDVKKSESKMPKKAKKKAKAVKLTFGDEEEG